MGIDIQLLHDSGCLYRPFARDGLAGNVTPFGDGLAIGLLRRHDGLIQVDKLEQRRIAVAIAWLQFDRDFLLVKRKAMQVKGGGKVTNGTVAQPYIRLRLGAVVIGFKQKLGISGIDQYQLRIPESGWVQRRHIRTFRKRWLLPKEIKIEVAR